MNSLGIPALLRWVVEPVMAAMRGKGYQHGFTSKITELF